MPRMELDVRMVIDSGTLRLNPEFSQPIQETPLLRPIPADRSILLRLESTLSRIQHREFRTIVLKRHIAQ